MRFTPKRLLVAGVVAVAAIATPVSLSVVLPGIGNSPASPATPAAPDTVIYNQGKGSNAPSSTFQATGRLRRPNP